MEEQKLSCNCYSWTENSQGPIKFLHFHKIFPMSIFLRCQKTRYYALHHVDNPYALQSGKHHWKH